MIITAAVKQLGRTAEQIIKWTSVGREQKT